MQDLLKENKDLQEAVLKKDAQLEAVDQEMARLREEAEARLVRLQEEQEATFTKGEQLVFKFFAPLVNVERCKPDGHVRGSIPNAVARIPR